MLMEIHVFTIVCLIDLHFSDYVGHTAGRLTCHLSKQPGKLRSPPTPVRKILPCEATTKAVEQL